MGLQVLKQNGHPWEIGKSFPGSAVVGPWVEIEKFPAYLDEEFTLAIDGQVSALLPLSRGILL